MADDIFPLSDEEQQAVAAPPVATPPPNPPPFVAAPGTGFGYSTNAPSDWTSPQTGTMGGVPVMVPGNAQNVFAVRGPAVQAPMQDQYWQQIERAYQNLPLAQAEQAITAATQYQGVRTYQRLLDQGVPAAEALQKAGPMMFFSGSRGAGLSGAAAMLRQSEPKPEYQFVPGTDVAPATFQAPGQKPVVVNRSALPLAEKDIAPKVFSYAGKDYLYNPQTGAITTPKGTELNDKDRLALAKAVPKMIADMQSINPESPEYATAKAMLEMVKREASGAAPAPKATAGVSITDSQGRKWRYLGSSPNPKTDKNPANWVRE